jgi:hypothetical protein
MWILMACVDPSSELRVAPKSLAPGLEVPETSGTSGTSSSTPSTSSTSGTTTSGTTTSGTTTTGTTTTGTGLLACYPGATGAYDVCLEVVELETELAEYDYPSPLDGDPQYSAPVRYLDLAAIDPATQLAPNFVLEEFAQEYKGQWAVVQVHTMEHLQDMRDELGALVVNSGYRNPDYNASIGGASYSRHTYGDGVDLDPVSVSLDELGDTCANHGAGYVELYETHVHCDWRDDPLDPAFYDVASFAGRPAPRVLPPVALVAQGSTLFAETSGWDEGEPLREWTAYGEDGRVLEQTTGRTYTPPEEAVEVEVWVGRQVKARIATL